MKTASEFLKNLSLFFSLDAKQKEQQDFFLSTYIQVFEENQKQGYYYDYSKILRLAQLNHKTKQFPTLKELLPWMEEAKYRSYNATVDEGKVIVITLDDGRKYDFVVAGMGKSLKSLKDELYKKYLNFKVDIYPKGTVIIGDKIFLPEE